MSNDNPWLKGERESLSCFIDTRCCIWSPIVGFFIGVTHRESLQWTFILPTTRNENNNETERQELRSVLFFERQWKQEWRTPGTPIHQKDDMGVFALQDAAGTDAGRPPLRGRWAHLSASPAPPAAADALQRLRAFALIARCTESRSCSNTSLCLSPAVVGISLHLLYTVLGLVSVLQRASCSLGSPSEVVGIVHFFSAVMVSEPV